MLGRCQVGAANLDLFFHFFGTCSTNLDPASSHSKLNPKLPCQPCRLWQQRGIKTEKRKMTTPYLILKYATNEESNTKSNLFFVWYLYLYNLYNTSNRFPYTFLEGHALFKRSKGCLFRCQVGFHVGSASADTLCWDKIFIQQVRGMPIWVPSWVPCWFVSGRGGARLLQISWCVFFG